MSIELLTPERVAEMLCVTRSQVMHLAREHRLASIKIGRSRRFYPQDVEAYLARNCTAPREVAVPTLGDALGRVTRR